jgi:hypothetical protein
MYLIAFLLVFIQSEQSDGQDYELLWVGAIAGVGLVRELWLYPPLKLMFSLVSSLGFLFLH